MTHGTLSPFHKRLIKQLAFGAVGTLLGFFLLHALSVRAQESSVPGGVADPVECVVEVKTGSVVHSDTIRLGEVAEFPGCAPDQVRLLSGVEIAPSPKAGEQLVIPKRSLLKMLAGKGVKVRIVAPDQTTIARQSQDLPPEAVKELLTAAAAEAAGWDPAKVEVVSHSQKEVVRLPEGDARIEFAFAKGESFRSRSATAKGTIFLGEKIHRTFYVTAVVNLIGTVIRAAQPIEKGQVVTEQDVEAVEEPVNRAPANAVTAMEEVVGMSALSAIRSGDVLTTNRLVAPLLIRRGALVRLVAQRNNLHVETSGIAQQDGARRQVIKVLNTSSNRIVYGEVTAEDEVRVKF